MDFANRRNGNEADKRVERERLLAGVADLLSEEFNAVRQFRPPPSDGLMTRKFEKLTGKLELSEQLALAADLEQDYFCGKPDEGASEYTVIQVQWMFDTDGDLNILCETRERRYGVVVVLSNSYAMTQAETSAVREALGMVSRGDELRRDSFLTRTEMMKSRHGQAYNELSNGRLFMILIPMKIENDVARRERQIISTALVIRPSWVDIICHNQLSSYGVSIYNPRAEQELSVQHCRAIYDTLSLLEPLARLDKLLYQAGVFDLRTKFFCGKQNPPTKDYPFLYLLIPTIFETGITIEQEFVDAARKRDEQEQSKPRYAGYQVGDDIVQSGQATVHRGLKEEDGAHVAIKIFHQNQGISSYKSELRLLLQMGGHKNVVDVIDFFEHPRPALVMPLIDGTDLMRFLRKGGKMLPAVARQMATDIAKGLYYLHRNKVVHRDVKSPNILVCSGTLKPIIIDFGHGQMNTGDLPSTGVLRSIETANPNYSPWDGDAAFNTRNPVGTDLWMAPEMIRDCTWSNKTDVYSFGLVIFELLSGKLPFEDRPWIRSGSQAIRERIVAGDRPTMSLVEGAPDDLQELIQDCWHPDPSKRPSMRVALDRLQGTSAASQFHRFDETRNGRLLYREFVHFMDEYCPGDVHYRDMYDLFESVDKNKSGAITFEEFAPFFEEVDRSGGTAADFIRRAKVKKRSRQSMLLGNAAEDNKVDSSAKQAFLALDLNGDGKIDLEEFRRFLHERAINYLSGYQIRRIFGRIDQDATGHIDFAEFRLFWNKVEALGLSGAIYSAQSADAQGLSDELQYVVTEKIDLDRETLQFLEVEPKVDLSQSSELDEETLRARISTFDRRPSVTDSAGEREMTSAPASLEDPSGSSDEGERILRERLRRLLVRDSPVRSSRG